MKFEILAPAGSRESLIAGVRCGVDAVYLGGKTLNARRNAGNFNDEELEKAVAYCHSRGVKVYITVNILCSDDELNSLYKFAGEALSFGADAFIVQDIGAAKLIKECFPQARIHASTQMSVMTPSGVAALKEMGFSRIVLPREMSMSEILEIRKSTDIKLEAFVHGALCMSVSGQCCLSAMLGGRSGNRGLCAQPCRLSFSADKSGGFDLSLKDLSLIRDLKKIESCGICSLKIEGRMKRPEYVAAAVTAVKKAVNGEYSENDEFVLKSVFSRNGFTNGYFYNKRGKNMFGTRKKEDVTAAAGVLKEISHLYDNENPLLPMKMKFICKKGLPAELYVNALGKNASVLGEIPEKVLSRLLTAESLSARLSKLGGTQFYASEIKTELDDGLIIPAAKINSMRREAVEKISSIEKKPVVKLPMPVVFGAEKSGLKYYTARFSQASQIPKNHPFKRIFIPIWSSDESFAANNAGVEIPRGLFGMEKPLKARLSQLKKLGVNKALCGNLGAYKTALDMGFKAYGDFGLNIFNSISAGIINSPILSFELTVESANKISASDTGVIVYGRLPLMLTRNCPVKNNIGCDKCRKKGTLTDRKGIEFPVKCSPYPCVEVLNSVPLYMADRMKEVKTDFAHFYFTDESREEVEKIMLLYKSGAKAPFNYTRGLYYRGGALMLVLASESPRRRELLRLISDDFEVKSSKQDESLPAGISPCNAVIYLSKIKVEPFKNSNDIVIGADTVVAVENKILGKPKNEKDAFEMLSLLSGRQHSVFTGVTIIKDSVVKSFYCRTMVKFYNLSEKEIKSYISCGECFDKAGAYGIQGKGSLLVEKIDGDYFNVVGLPVAKLYRELKALL